MREIAAVSTPILHGTNRSPGSIASLRKAWTMVRIGSRSPSSSRNGDPVSGSDRRGATRRFRSHFYSLRGKVRIIRDYSYSRFPKSKARSFGISDGQQADNEYGHFARSVGSDTIEGDFTLGVLAVQEPRFPLLENQYGYTINKCLALCFETHWWSFRAR